MKQHECVMDQEGVLGSILFWRREYAIMLLDFTA